MDRPLALYRRFLWESKNITWVYTSQLSQLRASRERYFESFGMSQNGVPKEAREALDALMFSATLACESQVARDSWGWTIRVPLKPWGLFCAVEPEGMVCAKFTALGEAASSDPVGGFTVQRVSSGAPVRQTSLIPADTVVEHLVEQYFEESEQLPARIAIRGDEGLMALSMPDARWEEVKDLKSAELFDLFHGLLRDGLSVFENAEDPELEKLTKAERIQQQFKSVRGVAMGVACGDLKLMHEAVFYYGCRCDEERIRGMIEALPQPQREALWGDLSSLDVECPRCGRKFTIGRGGAKKV